jgi:integrase
MAFLGFRFGLRAAEAALLRVRDVVGIGSGMFVIVERTTDRNVKTPNGRRTVPLVFRLSADELSALTTILAQARERARTDNDALLLADPARPSALVSKDGIARRVALELKAATGNSHLTDHHLRHSFASTIWQALEYPSHLP